MCMKSVSNLKGRDSRVPECRWNNIKMNHPELWCKNANWIQLAKVRVP